MTRSRDVVHPPTQQVKGYSYVIRFLHMTGARLLPCIDPLLLLSLDDI